MSASDLENPFYTAVWRGFTFFTPKFMPKKQTSSGIKGSKKCGNDTIKECLPSVLGRHCYTLYFAPIRCRAPS